MPKFVSKVKRTGGVYPTMVVGYLETAEWCGIDDTFEQIYKDTDDVRWAPEAILGAAQDCVLFLMSLIDDRIMLKNDVDWSQMGHDLWLSRNGHGTGFWDRDAAVYGEHADLKKLHQRAKEMGESYVEVLSWDGREGVLVLSLG